MNLFLGPVQLTIKFDAGIVPELLASANFTTPLIDPTFHYSCNFYLGIAEVSSSYRLLLHGEADDPDLMPYKWQILGAEKHLLALKIDFHKPEKIQQITALIDLKELCINVFFKRVPTSEELHIDPLLHPLGSLLLVYFANLTGGFLLHASGVRDMGQGYIFSAVSGTGKSTMAKLWQQRGAELINDDRLWLHKINGQWHALSTPMPWYAQKPLVTPVNKIFLLRQAPTNNIAPISGIKAQMRVMSNCIQHFHSKEMTEAHLNHVLDFTQNTPIYDCGFKPDCNIVDAIRALAIGRF